jgi:hypothetical protein
VKVAEELTAEQVLARNVDILGEELGRFYTDLSNECVWIHTLWLEIKGLFSRSQQRVDLLNRTAPYFFYLIQRSMYDNVLLHLARITDPPGAGHKQNVTVQALPQLISNCATAELIQEQLDKLLDSVAFARQHRNKRIAHIDLAARRGALSQPLEPATDAEALRYRLATTVPDNWIPFTPVRIDPAQPAVKLRRAAMVHLGVRLSMRWYRQRLAN